MQLDWTGWSSFILAITGLLGIGSTHFLGKRSKRVESEQQKAANELADRAQGFDEMEALVDRLNHEIARIEARNDREAQVQARRCRSALDHFMLAFTTLQGQVVSEVAKRAAEKALMDAEVHMAEDHPPEDPTPQGG